MSCTIPVVITFPDLGFSNEGVDVTEMTTIGNVVRDLSKRWEVDRDSFELTFEGSEGLTDTTKVIDLGIEAGSELVAMKTEITIISYRLEQLECEDQREKIRSYFETYPNAVCRLDAKSMSTNNCLKPREDWCDLIPETVRIVSFTNCDTVTSVGDGFLSDCTSLTLVDLSQLVNVTSIGNYFLSNCLSLSNIDLSQLSKTKHIGGSFLSGCARLHYVDLSFLSNITMLGNNFLSNCKALLRVDLSPLRHVSFIGNSFLSGCRALTEVDLTVMSEVAIVGKQFLSNCVSLSSLDVSSLSRASNIQEFFLSGCSGITSLELSPLLEVPDFDERGILNNCSAVVDIDRLEFLRTRVLNDANNSSKGQNNGIW
eukprot:TRINITY_DN1053_c0_g1_i2.p1 TRINITY_DN1053_c0_g1~~TRINITY_DN1053_c0_g1_i2.p1  ORF type:complete len:370 (+),score=62.53 TRINITY_DN1053_c0_g1_i2:657-1766(+)